MDKIRVMIVEDSAVMRQYLQHIIGRDPRLQIVAAVDRAEKALRLLEPLSPDVISMDIHLPGMNGLDATQLIMQRRPTPIVVVSGSGRQAEQKMTMHALRAGALTVVEKPVGQLHESYEAHAERLCTQLAIMSQVKVIRQRFHRSEPATAAASPDTANDCPSQAGGGFAVLGLVASTGGPGALQKLLPALGPSFPLPIVLVQHIMASFHPGFVSWLNDVCPFSVQTAVDGQDLQAGRMYVAPADRHLEVDGRVLTVRDGPPVQAQRPSGTVLFQSMACSLASRSLGVLLTGMGEDGAAGLREIRAAGGYTIAEDESTAVVYGMPAAAVQSGAVRESLPLPRIGPRLRELVTKIPSESRQTLVEERS